MKCEHVRNYILLDDAGELAPGLKAELETHLAGCEACRGYAGDTRRLTAVARRTLDDDGPAPAVLAGIRAAARRRVARPRLIAFGVTARVLAYAAALLVLAGGSWLLLTGNSRERRAEDMSALVAMVSEIDSISEAAVEEEGASDELRALARDLLRMEGLSADGDVFEEDFFSPNEEPASTDPLTRSSVSVPVAGCA